MMSHTSSCHHNDNPIPDNPIRRICESHGWAPEYVARAAGISKNTVYFIIRGMYNKIPAVLHKFFIERIDNYDVEFINNEYTAWQILKQNTAQIPAITEWSLKNKSNLDIHPLSNYLEFYKLSVLNFCEMLALPKPVVYNYINNQQLSIPGGLVAALTRAGVHSNEIRLLDTKSREFYNRMRERNVGEIRDINDARRRKYGSS